MRLTAFSFQKHGMIDGQVEHVSADATDGNAANGVPANSQPAKTQPLLYKTLVTLKAMRLEMDAERFVLGAGMQANAEILLGTRSVFE
ncbi:MAG: hypothetical protein NT159_01675 [Proteobacteria bacterium]|nr:hypothetical protein [Pseudomonadota bacterium]